MKLASNGLNGVLLHHRIFHAFPNDCLFAPSSNSLSYLLSTWSQIVIPCFLWIIQLNLHHIIQSSNNYCGILCTFIFTDTSGDAEEGPRETAARLGGGGAKRRGGLSTSNKLPCSTSAALQRDVFSVSISLVHLSYAPKHFLHIFPPAFTRLIPVLSPLCSS